MTDYKLRSKYFDEINSEVDKLNDNKYFYSQVNKYVAETF